MKRKLELTDWIVLLVILSQILGLFALKTPLTLLNYIHIVTIVALIVTFCINVFLDKAGE